MGLTTGEMMEVMAAFERGMQIESRDIFLDEDEPWVDDPCPCWNWVRFEFRVKQEKPEPKYRPYKDTEELIADWKERFNAKDWPPHSMPLIWLYINGIRCHVTDFANSQIRALGVLYTMGELFDDCTYLDGSPCGKEKV